MRATVLVSQHCVYFMGQHGCQGQAHTNARRREKGERVIDVSAVDRHILETNGIHSV